MNIRIEEVSLQVVQSRAEAQEDRIGENSHKRSSEFPKQNVSLVPRFPRFEFPTYDGKSDPLNWTNKCEQVFDHHNTPET